MHNKLNSNLLLDQYLAESFKRLELTSPLFYKTDIGIRFQIGNPDPAVTEGEYQAQVHYRATELFKAIHHPGDDLFIVLFLDVRRNAIPRRIKAFDHSLKNPAVLRSLSCRRLPNDEADNVEWELHRFVLSCKCSDLKYEKFLFSNYDIYFVNTTKHTIFYLYDSRGLDIAAYSKDMLRELYITYNEWILDYDREAIDGFFDS